MSAFRIVHLLVISSLVSQILVHGFSYQYVVQLHPSKEECFIQHFYVAGTNASVEYQALDGQPINFHVRSPDGGLLAADVRMATNAYDLTIQMPGDYELCFENMFSRFNKIPLFFEIYSEVNDPSYPWQNRRFNDTDSPEIVMEVALITLHRTFDNMMQAADKMKFLQQSIRMTNVKDRFVQEKNMFRVDVFSGIQLFVMITTSLMQVYMIRKLFQADESKTIRVST